MRRARLLTLIGSKFPSAVTAGALTATSITDSGLTANRVPFAGTGGLLQDQSGFSFSSSKLTVPGLLDSALSTGRIPYVGTIGEFLDTNNLRYDSTNDIVTEGWYSWKGGTLVTPDFSVTNSTTLTNITSLTASLKSGRYYRFRAVLFVDADTTGGHKYAMGGTCTAISIIYQVNSIANATNLNVINSRQTALGGSVGQAGSTAYHTIIEGCINVNQAGTLTVQVAENTAVSLTSVTVKALSTFEVVDFSYS